MKAIILDRDGVINQDSSEFIKNPDEWIALKGSLEAIAKLKRAGYAVFIVTNQSGVARKLFTVGALTRIHRKMIEAILHHGGEIDAILYCPHGPDDCCECRKPKPGLFMELAERLNLNLSGVPAVGDSIRDLQAAKAAGAKPILVRTGNGQKSAAAISKGQHEDLGEIESYKSLADYVDHLLKTNHS